MATIISSNVLRLQPDNLTYQAARVQLPDQPANAQTMVMYYKAYLEIAANNPDFEYTDSFAWGRHAFFGLSFSGTVSQNTGGIVGFSSASDTYIRVQGLASSFPIFLGSSGYSQVSPVSFGQNDTFGFGAAVTGRFSAHNNSQFFAGQAFPTTQGIGVDGAKKYLGIIQVAKHSEDVQRVILSYGNNWQNLTSANFSSALSSSLTNWAFRNVSQVETTNFRPNHANADVALRSTITFPRWIVARWPSGIVGRNFVITDIKVEYYD